MPERKKIPKRTTHRALLYLRTLNDLQKQGKKFISSRDLAEITGLTDVQIRKDISNLAPVGKPRVGYEIQILKKLLEDVFQYKTAVVVLFGVGNLGKAILKYPGFHTDKIQLSVAFDDDPKKIGKTINGVTVYSLSAAPRVIAKNEAEIGIIATPKEHSQSIADLMVRSGLNGIMNFSPSTVSVPEHIQVRSIDLGIELLSLFSDIQQA